VEAHPSRGHLSQQSTKDTAKQLGWHLKGEFATYEYCAIGTGLQKRLIKGVITKLLAWLAKAYFWIFHQFKNRNNLIIKWNNTGESWWIKSHNLRLSIF
jgi:hypothetical protein